MVYLVGAGPGDSGLITCRGRWLLENCDAVIYDHLGTNELLELVPEDCQKIYVGKRAGAHSKKQEEINEILIRTAKSHHRVVRLKGGDPFVFGRGGEEVLALKEAGIPFQLVPGVTSAIAVPELFGVPVTHRGMSRSFHVFTGHTKAGDQEDYSYIHKEDGTSVFLMGCGHLQNIVDRLLEDGAQENLPAAVLSRGTLPGEAMVRGTLQNIVSRAAKASITTPAIVVVGETADCRFCPDDRGGLYRRKIGLIATRVFREKLRLQLEEDGTCVYSLCNMDIVKTSGYQQLSGELQQMERYGWIGFTSQNAVRLFFQRVRECRMDLRRFSHIRFAVLGTGTGEMLLQEGFHADYMPQLYTTEAFGRGLVERFQKKPDEAGRILIPRAKQGSDRLVQILEENGIAANIIPIYDVVGRPTENWEYLYDLDAIIFASPSGAEAFAEILKEKTGSDRMDVFEQKRQEAHVKIAGIGPVTAECLKKYGITADAVPNQCDIPHLIEKLKTVIRSYS